MFELNIQLSVKLHTGEVVTLTEEQTKRIKNYATEVLLGAPTPVDKPTDAPRVKRKYTKKSQARTLASIICRVSQKAEQYRKNDSQLKEAQVWNPVIIRTN